MRDGSVVACTSRAAAVMAYNLYFQPSYFKLLKYLSALGTRVENKVLFAVNCVSVFQQVKKRWQVLKTTGERHLHSHP
jgi:hypothetical protein